MSSSSRNSSTHNTAICWLVAGCWLLVAGTGCESLQKKFIRKPKAPLRPAPITAFQDYTHASTPLDRYRKHYLMFDYWNSQLLDTLQQPDRMNPKRAERTSGEAVTELQTLQGLLRDDVAAGLTPLIEERRKIHQRLRSHSSAPSQVHLIRRTLESQTRQVRRQFYWRQVEDHLKETDAGAP